VFSLIDNLLNRITMYRLLLYYLITLVLAAIGLSALGVLHFGVIAIAVSTTILVITCWVVNKILAAIFQAPTNIESVYITALILALIITPMASHTKDNITFLLAAAGLAMASKYILTIRKKHIFNPAAIAVALTAIGPHQSASWWVGTKVMLPFVLIGGILLARKIRRGRMVLSFFISTLLATIVYTMLAKGNVFSALDKTVVTSAMFFLGFVMLTEPLTTPPTTGKQTWYAALIGILFPPQFHILSLYSTPELALIAGNIFSYIISPKTKLFPVLKQKLRITPDSADFIFDPAHKFSYKPGQYMEWTLPHSNTDSRGNRRYFTLASSPTENDIRIGVKFYKRSSSYKEALMKVTPETPIVAAQIAGDFILPKNKQQKLVFIAGGIGITPYRSMVKYLLDTKERRTITLLYSAKTADDFAYKEIFEQAKHEIGLNVVYVITNEDAVTAEDPNQSKRINAGIIRDQVPDYRQCLFYVSGTHAMVIAMQDILSELGVPRNQVKIDFFSGYV
jgi:ferredoxin-NADP reductase/Na+-translocating ferredoxin:NAD+ oxidoreductase RnfD subunit